MLLILMGADCDKRRRMERGMKVNHGKRIGRTFEMERGELVLKTASFGAKISASNHFALPCIYGMTLPSRAAITFPTSVVEGGRSLV